MKISTVLHASVTVSPETLDFMDGFGWADGEETCCASYDLMLEHINDMDASYDEIDMKRYNVCKEVIAELKKQNIYPDDVIFTL